MHLRHVTSHRATLLALTLPLGVAFWPTDDVLAQSWEADRGYADGPIAVDGPLQAEPLFECMGGRERFHLFVRWRGEAPSVVGGQLWVRWDDEDVEHRLTHGTDYQFEDRGFIARLRRHGRATFRLVGAHENLTRRPAPEATFIVSLQGSRQAIDGARRNC